MLKDSYVRLTSDTGRGERPWQILDEIKLLLRGSDGKSQILKLGV